MRKFIIAIVLAVACGSLSAAGALPTAIEADPNAEAALRHALLRQFDTFLQDPNAFAQRVARECRGFPEGDLMTYSLPACAYVQIGLSDSSQRAIATKRVEQLLDLARPGVLKRVKTDDRGLAGISDYQRQATYLGQYNLALGGYRLLGGKRFSAEHKAISDALHTGLIRSDGGPLASYPYLTWTFDTIPCLVSLRLYDHLAGKPRSAPAIARHLSWLAERATHPATGLPFSQADPNTGKGIAPPRGCELSWRLALMADLDAPAARRLYANYVRSFWLDRTILAGFAEWPGGKDTRQDFDSGPVIMGIGSAATAFGLAAAKAAGDTTRRDRLIHQAAIGRELLKRLIALAPQSAGAYTMSGKIDPDSPYCTGFLFGDACLFYSVTWCRWLPDEPPGKQ
jgi:hypothetical protein